MWKFLQSSLESLDALVGTAVQLADQQLDQQSQSSQSSSSNLNFNSSSPSSGPVSDPGLCPCEVVSEALREFIRAALIGHPEVFTEFPFEDGMSINYISHTGGTLRHYAQMKSVSVTASSALLRPPPNRDVLGSDESRAKHAAAVLRAVPELNDLRFQLVPARLTDSKFWIAYFAVVGRAGRLPWDFTGAIERQMECEERDGTHLLVQAALRSDPELLWTGIEEDEDTYYPRNFGDLRGPREGGGALLEVQVSLGNDSDRFPPLPRLVKTD